MTAASVLARARAAFRGGPLAVRSFRLLAVGQLTSTVGDYCYAVALPWLVLSNHGSPALLGTVLACYGVPRTVLIPAGGVLADRIGPRLLMVSADTVRCCLVAVLVVLATQRLASLAVLGPVAALIGAGEGLFVPASYAIMPALVEPDQLQAANGISSALLQVGTLIGPVLGGALVALAGPAPAFAADAASFAVSAGSLALIATRRAAAPESAAAAAGSAPGLELAAVPGVEPFAVPGPEATSTADSAPASAADAQTAGTADSTPANEQGVLSLLLHSRLLQSLLVVTVVANLAAGGTLEVALPDLAHARFGAAGYGALLACLGAGGLTGTLTAARSSSLRRPAVVSLSAFLVAAVAIALIPYLGGLAGAAPAVLVFGAGAGFGNVVMITLMQHWAPSRLLGRVMSLVMLASLGSFPVSVAVAGILVRRLGPPPFFPICAAVLAVALVGALSQRQIRKFGAADPPGPADPPGVTDQAAPAPDAVR
jgi:predicted MFS family arabinose efflux permease